MNFVSDGNKLRHMLDTASLKQARAALFLVPILGIVCFLIYLIYLHVPMLLYSILIGLNYLLIPIRPAEGSGLTVAYDIMNAVFSSFQVINSYY